LRAPLSSGSTNQRTDQEGQCSLDSRLELVSEI
jgi:hypothetical protein